MSLLAITGLIITLMKMAIRIIWTRTATRIMSMKTAKLIMSMKTGRLFIMIRTQPENRRRIRKRRLIIRTRTAIRII